MRQLRAGALLLLLALPPHAGAQTEVPRPGDGSPVAPLTLEEVLGSVARTYPLVEVARQDAAAAQAQVQAALGGFDPEVKARATDIPFGPYPYTRVETGVQQPTPWWGARLFGGWRYGGGDIPVYYGEYLTNRGGEVRGGVSVPLWRNGPVDARRAALEEARLAAQAASLGVFQSQLEAARSAAQRYWDWVAAGRKLAVARALLALAQDRDAQLAERVRRGDVPAFERTDNVRALVQREGQVVAAERAVQQAALELSLFLRDAQGRPVLPSQARLPQAFPAPAPVEALVGQVDVAEVLARRPDVQRLQAQRGQQRVEQRLAANQQAPAVDVTVAASKDLGGGSARLARPELELGLSVELPTLNRTATGKAAAAQASVARVDAQLRLQQDEAVVEVRDALSALEAARLRVALARREVEVARELEEGERTRFSLGDSSLLFVNLREQTTAEAAVREVDALADFFKALATLRTALALPPGTSAP